MTRYKNPTLAYFHCQIIYTKKKKKKKKRRRRENYWQRDRERVKNIYIYILVP